ncbi:MAG: transaldolase [Terriglobia bacterium]
MNRVSELKVKLFADGADLKQVLGLKANPIIRGFTTNPTLMRAAGVRNYEEFARDFLKIVTDRPVSFEVFADEFCDMERQAQKLASWADNVYVKIPVTNTRGQSSTPLVGRLSRAGVKVNLTAAMTLGQVRDAVAALAGGAPAAISVFAGRIADTGRDPVPIMAAAVELLSTCPKLELIWASPRELLNVFQANSIGCHVITITGSMLAKLGTIGRDLADYSLETVTMFHTDALQSGYHL